MKFTESEYFERLTSGDLKDSCQWYIDNNYELIRCVRTDAWYAEFFHKDCGSTVYIKLPYNLRNHIGCPKCKGKRISKTKLNTPQNIKDQINQKVIKTNLERYGVAHWVNPEKAKQTNLERYGGTGFQSKELLKKAQDTNIERYGAPNPFQSELIKDRIKQTNLEKYGYEFINQVPEIKDKIKKTNIERYGGTGMASPELAKKHFITLHSNNVEQNPNYQILYDKEKLITYLESYGRKTNVYELSDSLNIGPQCIQAWIGRYELSDQYLSQPKKGSLFQENVTTFVQSLDVSYKTNVIGVLPGKLELDIYIPDYKVAIECNGTYWHSSVFLSKDYHYKKYLACKELGIRLIQVWEYEWDDKIKRTIIKNIISHACNKTKIKIPARKCKIKVLPNNDQLVKDFVNQNNIAGSRGYREAICLFYQDELVMCYTLGHAYFGKGKYDIEIIRGASKLGVLIQGGASKLWNYIITSYMPSHNYTSCVYYVDNNYYNASSQNTGSMEGLEFISHEISFKNWWLTDGMVRNRDPRNHKEIMKLTNDGLIIPIYNVGSDVYVYRRV